MCGRCRDGPLHRLHVSDLFSSSFLRVYPFPQSIKKPLNRKITNERFIHGADISIELDLYPAYCPTLVYLMKTLLLRGF